MIFYQITNAQTGCDGGNIGNNTATVSHTDSNGQFVCCQKGLNETR